MEATATPPLPIFPSHLAEFRERTDRRNVEAQRYSQRIRSPRVGFPHGPQELVRKERQRMGCALQKRRRQQRSLSRETRPTADAWRQTDKIFVGDRRRGSRYSPMESTTRFMPAPSKSSSLKARKKR